MKMYKHVAGGEQYVTASRKARLMIQACQREEPLAAVDDILIPRNLRRVNRVRHQS